MKDELKTLKKKLDMAENSLEYLTSPETKEDVKFDIACDLVERSYQETGINNYHVSNDDINKILAKKIAEEQETIKNLKETIGKYEEKQEGKTKDVNEIKDMILEMQDKNYGEFVKALISIEKGIDDEMVLDSIYSRYMNEDSMSLLDENFDYIIDEIREEGSSHNLIDNYFPDSNRKASAANIEGNKKTAEPVERQSAIQKLEKYKNQVKIKMRGDTEELGKEKGER